MMIDLGPFIEKIALSVASQLAPSPRPEEWLSVKQAAEHLGISESQCYKLAKEGRLPGRKLAGSWKFSRSQLDQSLGGVAA